MKTTAPHLAWLALGLLGAVVLACADVPENLQRQASCFDDGQIYNSTEP